MKVTITVEDHDFDIEVTEKPNSYAAPVEDLLERALTVVRTALAEERRKPR